MPSSIRIDRDVPMEMRDGVILRVEICRPDDNGKHPAILTRTAYDKNSRFVVGDGGFLCATGAAYAGYARVIQDVRGRFASDGEAGDMLADVKDGYDTVEWIASQPWCDGNVGMFGASLDGALQWPTARGNPPHLKAIAPDVCPTGRQPERLLFGGPILLAFHAHYFMLMAIDAANRMEKQGKDVSELRELLDRGFSNIEEVYSFLPLKDIPQFQLEGPREMWKQWALDFHPDPDLFWPYEEIQVAGFHSGGWFDHNSWSTFNNYLGVRDRGGSQNARENQHIFMGPWKHGVQATDYLGDIDFGTSAGVPGLLVGRESVTTKPHMDFFNKYLRGMDVEVPAVRYFVMGKNVWRTADIWPLPGTQQQRFFLHSEGNANTAAGDGLLGRDEPRSETPDSFVYDPQDPVPTVGGRMLSIGGMIPGPRDQVYVEKRSDVLCYTTPELKEDTEVTGMLELHLFAATSAKDTDFCVKLNDVYPDGRSYVIADGAIRARYHKSIFKPEPVTPGEVNEYTINMGYTSNCFKKGHRIRLTVTSSNFPSCDRNMNTGNPIGEDAKGIPAKQTICHQSGAASYIDLPVIQ